MEINIPSVVAEVTAAFERYEKALNSNDVATLDELFWQSPHTLRYGVGEQLYGYDQIAAFRSGRDPGFVANRDLLKLWVVTYGHDFGTANCEFRRHGQNKLADPICCWDRQRLHTRSSRGWEVLRDFDRVGTQRGRDGWQQRRGRWVAAAAPRTIGGLDDQ